MEDLWKIVGQLLDTNKKPHELKIKIKADRGAKYPCPVCGKMCKAYDFKEKIWRHINLFQHHCYITAVVPRTNCPDHEIKTVKVPWAKKAVNLPFFLNRQL